MKSLKRVIALICVATMLLSMSAFAFEADDYALKLKASKTTVAPGETFTLTVYAEGATSAKGFVYTYGNVDYNGSEFTFGDYKASNESYDVAYDGVSFADKENSIIIEVDEKSAVYTNDNGEFISFDVTVNEDVVAGDYTILLTDMYYESDDVESDYYNDTLTITVKEAGPVGPVSVATTMTIGEKEYTSVPNALVENVDFTDGVITGALNIDYWKNGEKVNTPVVIEATKFAGMPANVTGTGTASFTVALMGVPSNVVVTGISFK